MNATEAVLPPTKESPFLPDPVYKLTLHDKLTVYMQCAKFQIVKVYYISKARCQDVEGLVDLQLVEGIQVSLEKKIWISKFKIFIRAMLVLQV